MEEDLGADFGQIQKGRHRSFDLIADTATLQNNLWRLFIAKATAE
jgi:hypothetical protein